VYKFKYNICDAGSGGGGILVGSYPSAWKDGNKVVSYIYKHYQLQHIFLYDKEIGNRLTNKLPNESVFV